MKTIKQNSNASPWTQLLILPVALGCLAVTGCGPAKTDADQSITSTNVAVKLDQAKKDTQEAVASIKDYTYAQRDEYAAQIHAKLDQIKLDLDALGTKVDQSTFAATEDAKAKIQAMRDQLAKANQKLDGMATTTESGWEDFKAGVKQASDDTKTALDQARQWLADKIAP